MKSASRWFHYTNIIREINYFNINVQILKIFCVQDNVSTTQAQPSLTKGLNVQTVAKISSFHRGINEIFAWKMGPIDCPETSVSNYQ
jgi:hypothetical protein